jgi:hypothetical protein
LRLLDILTRRHASSGLDIIGLLQSQDPGKRGGVEGLGFHPHLRLPLACPRSSQKCQIETGIQALLSRLRISQAHRSATESRARRSLRHCNVEDYEKRLSHFDLDILSTLWAGAEPPAPMHKHSTVPRQLEMKAPLTSNQQDHATDVTAEDWIATASWQHRPASTQGISDPTTSHRDAV